MAKKISHKHLSDKLDELAELMRECSPPVGSDLHLMRFIGPLIQADPDVFCMRDVMVLITLGRGMFWSKDLDNSIRELARFVHSRMEQDYAKMLSTDEGELLPNEGEE